MNSWSAEPATRDCREGVRFSRVNPHVYEGIVLEPVSSLVEGSYQDLLAWSRSRRMGVRQFAQSGYRECMESDRELVIQFDKSLCR